MPTFRRLLVLAAAVVLLAGCTAHGTPAAPATATTAAPAATPSPSPTLAAAVTVDQPARDGCRLLAGAKADLGIVDPAEPKLRQAADLLSRSQHFSLRSDGLQLGGELDVWVSKRGTVDEGASAEQVTVVARQVDADCVANGANKPAG